MSKKSSNRPQPALAHQPPHPALSAYYAEERGRRRRLRRWFDGAAIDYDRINAIMSMGTGARYRKAALHRLGLADGDTLLDVGAGTGVMTRQAQKCVGTAGLAVALDPSPGMLQRARDRGVRLTVPGIGEQLPFTDAAFNVVVMGYALRHVADLGSAFGEYLRVLKPGGRVLLLEITRPAGSLGSALLRIYMGWLVPRLTRWLQRSPLSEELMRYYWETIDRCVRPEVIMDSLRAAGFVEVRRTLFLGIFSEYSATKLTGPAT